MAYSITTIGKPVAADRSFDDLVARWRVLIAQRADALLTKWDRARISPKAYELLKDEASDKPWVSNFGGWATLTGNESPRVLIVGQNPYTMSFATSRQEVMANLTTSDKKFLWLACALSLRVRGYPPMDRKEWARQIYSCGKLCEPLQDVRILNLHAFRYYVEEGDRLTLKKSLTRNQSSAGPHCEELTVISHELIRAIAAIETLEVMAITSSGAASQRNAMMGLQSQSDQMTLVTSFHPRHPSTWNDFTEIIEKVGRDSTETGSWIGAAGGAVTFDQTRAYNL